MTRRARTLAVVLTVLCGAVGVLSATQTWLHVSLAGAASDDLAVSGTAALAVATPLCLAVLALGVALSIVGRVLRYVFGGIAVVIAAVLGYLTAVVVATRPVSAVARTVTDATGITGDDPVAHLIASMSVTAWPFVMLAGMIVLLVTGVFILLTAHTWTTSGRRYRTDVVGAAPTTGTLDAVDSWDDLSRGDDPTAGDDRR
ncbi:Trp biosynthesis-associated membrane protein [Microbacterium horticulturae]|uniref:Trp biosynthesis-associated membrane protein n=1 Tax=Microbacterium horticulturae TaxID=3028316 RepID=A0ABY8C625_9MICO|nr:Trp biosynthesis-associated membrane protein [Microbacterium sp. KACC 23027]WEG10531.1 Trp biosynthesis-associated membrane protein [Microbacterium sp. KACC 23027]